MMQFSIYDLTHLNGLVGKFKDSYNTYSNRYHKVIILFFYIWNFETDNKSKVGFFRDCGSSLRVVTLLQMCPQWLTQIHLQIDTYTATKQRLHVNTRIHTCVYTLWPSQLGVFAELESVSYLASLSLWTLSLIMTQTDTHAPSRHLQWVSMCRSCHHHTNPWAHLLLNSRWNPPMIFLL